MIARLQRLGDAEHDDFEVAHDALAEIILLRADKAELTDKALRFDLDRAGIEQREREAVELVELRAKNERLRAAAQAVVDRWHTPLWKDAEPTAAVFQRLKDALRGEGE